MTACIMLAFAALNILSSIADVLHLAFSNEANMLLSFTTNAEVDCMIDALICMDRIHAWTKGEITIWIKCRLDGKILLSFFKKKHMEEG